MGFLVLAVCGSANFVRMHETYGDRSRNVLDWYPASSLGSEEEEGVSNRETDRGCSLEGQISDELTRNDGKRVRVLPRMTTAMLTIRKPTIGVR